MAVIASNIIIGAKEKVKAEPSPAQKTISQSFDDLKTTQPRRNKQVIIEKRAKLTDSKPDRKSAYVRDMTTVHKI